MGISTYSLFGHSWAVKRVHFFLTDTDYLFPLLCSQDSKWQTDQQESSQKEEILQMSAADNYRRWRSAALYVEDTGSQCVKV